MLRQCMCTVEICLYGRLYSVVTGMIYVALAAYCQCGSLTFMTVQCRRKVIL